MQRVCILLFLAFFSTKIDAQQSDFAHINFTKADNIAKSHRKQKLKNINALSFSLTKDLDTDIEKFRSIYYWVTHNIANDHRLYRKNNLKRKKYDLDTIALEKWNSKFKRVLFKKLMKRKRTICTGYAYLIKEMCEVVGIKVQMIHGYSKTPELIDEQYFRPNHTWIGVNLDGKWYLCDPTWATGISYPENGKFVFDYNDGYFLTNPKLFILSHYPLEPEWSLLGESIPSFETFAKSPLLYGEAYNMLSEHQLPEKMKHTVQQNTSLTFQYKLKEPIDNSKLKFVFVAGTNEYTKKPKITSNNDILTLECKFPNRGFYDVHLYLGKEIIATYVVKVVKETKL